MKVFLKYFSLSLFILCCSSNSYGQEGMWIPSLLSGQNEAEMQEMGMKMTAEDIYSINEGSLKDAIVHFGGFCTGEVISDRGLLLTNHHCGYRQIQSHSSLEKNLLDEGYWASSLEDELPNPGLFARFIKEITDVTPLILKGVKKSMTEKERSNHIAKNIERVKEQMDLGPYESVDIKPFYDGYQYYALTSVRYDDVRLVGAPPSSIGKFGADTDNWVWPRHTGDFSLFRIYAGPDNEPAPYSEDNKPFRPEHHLPISLDGVDPGDFTLIFGFPGTTQEYLPAIAIQQLVEEINPARIAVRDRSLAVMDKAMKNNEEIKIQYASKFASIANYWKKWQGENLGLKRSGAVEVKKEEQDNLRKKLRSNDKWLEEYGGTLMLLEKNYKQSIAFRRADAIYGEIMNRNVDAFRIAGYCSRLLKYYDELGEDGYVDFAGRLHPFLENVYEGYSTEVDEDLAVELLQAYQELMKPEFVPQILEDNEDKLDDFVRDYFRLSIIPDRSVLELMDGEDIEVAVETLRKDPLITLYKSFDELYRNDVLGPLSRFLDERDSLQRQYMEAQIKVADEDARIFPDANSTLRVGYGQVSGYSPRDGMKYLHQTYLDGVMEKYEPGDYEFDVPERLIELYNERDYGPYGEMGKMPVCFIGSNHTTGGNSGSPAIDAEGNLVGLNFDRVWEGTMSDYHYDFEICRNIMVDARYILFIIDKFGNAPHLVEEMELVHPKGKHKKWQQRAGG
jgi:hypothetical protein